MSPMIWASTITTAHSRKTLADVKLSVATIRRLMTAGGSGVRY